MNLTQLVIEWLDSLGTSRRTVRPITPEITDSWIDGWFSGTIEMISYRGGRVIEVHKEELK
jgi:hypothetical protein